MPPKSTTRPRHKPIVNFGSNGTSRKRCTSPAEEDPVTGTATSSKKKARTGGPLGSTNASASASGATGTNTAPETTLIKKRVRNRWGVSPKEVPPEAKLTQRAFQCFIRGLCGMLTQTDILPSSLEAQRHYDKRYDNVVDFHQHMRHLIDESRKAVSAAMELATKLVKDAERISGPIANDIARIPEVHLATVFTMILKAGLQGFCPDLEGPVQSRYNQLHRHLAISGFRFLSSSFALSTLEVNPKKIKMERHRPGSLAQSVKNGVEYKARSRLSQVRFKTATEMGLRKLVLRMACVEEAHSDDEHRNGVCYTRNKPGRNPVPAKFFHEDLDPAAEAYRKRNTKPGQNVISESPSLFGTILPPNVPVNYFTPEFFNALTVKERAQYAKTCVAFPLEEFAFDEAHEDWKKMGKKEFMEMYGNDVLEYHDIPSQEEIDELPKSDVEDDEEEVEIDLEDTEDEAEDEMEVEDELGS
ncbi:hypothetical protein DFH07DRAFT_963050 [Mycena maculata]|uniref:Uncharacterized protein n=1 Tax=Mycena maculata TaxID=230809 RepID=A0AAD7IMI2_9AGAR|nr:hypothetical protein DFH07DRAFT_963050 [Mycena maculata]